MGGTRPHFLQKLEKKNGSEIKRPEMLTHVKTEMKHKVGKETEGGSKNVRKWLMNQLWLPCFNSNGLPMTYRKHKRRIM